MLGNSIFAGIVFTTVFDSVSTEIEETILIGITNKMDKILL